MTLFKKLNGNPEKPFSLTIEEPAPGTVACSLGEPSNPIIRKFFYLNGEPRHLSALGQGVWGRVGPGNTWAHGKGVSRVPGHLASWWSMCSLVPDSSGRVWVEQGPPHAWVAATGRSVAGARAAGIAAAIPGSLGAEPHDLRGLVPTVSEGSVEEEKQLQGVFTTVLQSLDAENPQPSVPTLGLALAAGSTAFILLLL